MSVIMTLTAQGDAGKLEGTAADDPDRISSIADVAKEHGLMAHRFYGAEDGRIMVVDEWPDPDSFQSFYDEAQPQIQSIMADIGVASEPEVTFWRKLETHDDVGWAE